MRGILFRGKRLDDDAWVEGYLVCDSRAWGKTDVHTYIVNHEHPSGCFGSDIYIEVDPSTVGQYTGLTDKNGERIFEGDIVESADFTAEDGYGVVEWYDGAFEIGNGEWCGTFHENYNGKEFEVIGNIHDNPELLEG